MKTKLVCLFISIVFCFSLSSYCSATEDAGVNLNAELSFEKREFAAGEDIGITLTVTNASESAVKNVRAVIIYPKGFEALSGNFAPNAFALNSGERKAVAVEIQRPGTAVESDNEPESKPVQTDPVEDEPSEEKLFLWIYITLTVILICGAVTFFIVKFKWYNGAAAIFICVLLLSAVVHASKVSAAPRRDGFTVSEAITVGGEIAVVKAVISYEYIYH